MRQTDNPLRVLIGCEFSGTVRRAFAARGHDAWSCDLLPSADRSNKHLIGDVREFLHDGWDLLMVAHPPCTRLCNSGVRWLSAPPGRLTAEHYTPLEIAAYSTMSEPERLAFMWRKLDEGAALFSDLWNAPIERVCLENPVMHTHGKQRIRNYREFAQSVQPWHFGEPESKRTCLWLRGLPTLTPTYRTWDECREALGLPDDAKPVQRVHSASPGPARWAERSKFFDGIANAMADQWGDLPAAPVTYREAA
ncbi:hypothetical protein X747_14400 [Mesorhizobium sp. LNJC384A00]|uniref:hypothetical protein n=1 Tax=Mesorhizobium sp. LNJC384A00 TaxID=1287268 RepID=UPI0003CED46B|nr:hypothetical protein [Mesorhizobium sp. LNJC384A00]ESY41882.1 hypothetical protein X747_14400 [Mesorhizobium sp. LNJC384A00]